MCTYRCTCPSFYWTVMPQGYYGSCYLTQLVSKFRFDTVLSVFCYHHKDNKIIPQLDGLDE